MTAPITDFTQYTGLRAAASHDDPAALRQVAAQFEALFLQSMLKSMRDASLGDPLFGDSEQMQMYEEMLDKQMAANLASEPGIGLADLLVRQLGGIDATAPDGVRSDVIPAAARHNWNNPDDFASAIWPHARRAARRLNVPAEAILAQAALETGWGKHVMPDNDGNNSFNLFGIKTGRNWQGEAVSRHTLEVRDGIAQTEQARFRSYTSVAQAIDDYVRLLTESPRYAGVLNQDSGAGFADALQESGYATDPDYATKIRRILDSPTLKRATLSLQPEKDGA